MFSLAKLYGGLLLAQRIETPEQFNLIVRWQSLEDHTPGFEASEEHRMFMMGLQEYFSEEPRVYHIEGATFAIGENLLKVSKDCVSEACGQRIYRFEAIFCQIDPACCSLNC